MECREALSQVGFKEPDSHDTPGTAWGSSPAHPSLYTDGGLRGLWKWLIGSTFLFLFSVLQYRVSPLCWGSNPRVKLVSVGDSKVPLRVT